MKEKMKSRLKYVVLVFLEGLKDILIQPSSIYDFPLSDFIFIRSKTFLMNSIFEKLWSL